MKEYLPLVLLIALGSIIIELIYSKRIRFRNFNWVESRISFVVFVLGQIANLASRSALGVMSAFLYQHRLFEITWHPAITFPVLFLLSEFLYYWMHRYTHEVRLGWMSHVVHHSPTCFNTSIAYRLGITNFLSGVWIFHLPLSLLGFDPKMVVLCIFINLMYQFFIHTELVGKLGFLEYFFNTPSHHRVHHASNPLYLDRNYGGVVIIFDRMFGTFQEEQEEIKIKYGVSETVRYKNAITISLMGWRTYIEDCFKVDNWPDRFRLLFAKPGWHPQPATSKTAEQVRQEWLLKNARFRKR